MVLSSVVFDMALVVLILSRIHCENVLGRGAFLKYVVQIAILCYYIEYFIYL